MRARFSAVTVPVMGFLLGLSATLAIAAAESAEDHAQALGTLRSRIAELVLD